MIRGFLAILALLGYGLLSLAFFAILLLRTTTPGIIIEGIGFIGFDAFYPIAALYVGLHALLGFKQVVTVLDRYAWDHRD